MSCSDLLMSKTVFWDGGKIQLLLKVRKCMFSNFFLLGKSSKFLDLRLRLICGFSTLFIPYEKPLNLKTCFNYRFQIIFLHINLYFLIYYFFLVINFQKTLLNNQMWGKFLLVYFRNCFLLKLF